MVNLWQHFFIYRTYTSATTATTTGVIEFSPGWMPYWLADYDNKTFEELNGYGNYSWDIEVIGNIHDNPELLKGGWQE